MPFQSANFLKFADEWGFKTTTSSPNFPQSNGQVERTIQTLKRSLKKADYEGKDPYLSLLEYRNTLVAGFRYSPVQILISKRLRSKIPCALNLLKPCVVDITESLSAAQYRLQVYYKRGTKPLPMLCEKGKEYIANSAIAEKVLLSQDLTLILVRTLYRVVMDVFVGTVGICLGHPRAIRLLVTIMV